MGLHDEARLDQKFIALAKLMNIHLNHFPAHEKYGLALEIRRTAYEVYAFIVEAQKRYQKKTTLTNLDVRHEQLRMLVRLAYEMGYFEFSNGKKADRSREELAEHRYLALSRLIDELGRMIGGWIVADRKAIEQREAS
ncbi:four helix bundle protein [Propionivibrio sp.]|uniref:four helix bundle protein n=1 Tax=Propionivibrio sp. TaxID=2212460 RepID=UPI003BF0278C